MEAHVPVPADFHKTIFDALPIPAFVVNGTGEILDCNQAANILVKGPRVAVLNRRGGEVLGCIHAIETPGGCGAAPACGDCVIRGSVRQALTGESVSRRAVKMRIARGAELTDAHMLITAAPIRYRNELLVLLVLEDITELVALRGIVPICASCRKVKDDRQHWQNVESYLKRHLDLEFSHGICPDCMLRLYPQFEGPAEG